MCACVRVCVGGQVCVRACVRAWRADAPLVFLRAARTAAKVSRRAPATCTHTRPRSHTHTHLHTHTHKQAHTSNQEHAHTRTHTHTCTHTHAYTARTMDSGAIQRTGPILDCVWPTTSSPAPASVRDMPKSASLPARRHVRRTARAPTDIRAHTQRTQHTDTYTAHRYMHTAHRTHTHAHNTPIHAHSTLAHKRSHPHITHTRARRAPLLVAVTSTLRAATSR